MSPTADVAAMPRCLATPEGGSNGMAGSEQHVCDILRRRVTISALKFGCALHAAYFLPPV